MRKILLAILSITLVASVVLFYFVKTEKVILRTPIVVQQKIIVTYVIGKVKYKKPYTEDWINCIVGTELEQGSEIKTAKSSIADIRLHYDTAIRLNENSLLKVDNVTVKNLLLKMDKGSIHGKFKKLFDRHQIRIQTPTTIASIRGTELAIVVNEPVTLKEQDQAITTPKSRKQPAARKKIKEQDAEPKEVSTTVYTISGIIEVSNPSFQNQSILLSNQKKATVSLSSPPGNPEDMSNDEVLNFRSILNSLHFNEVLLITNKIYFETGSASILPESFPELDKIALVLNKRRENIMIEGHTDSTGAAYANQELSVQRSKAIQDYLVKRGVKDGRLMISGYGESKPIASNDSEDGRALNRRVEFIIMK